MNNKNKKFIEYFNTNINIPVKGCPLIEIEMPKVIHNEWIQWTEKYREYKDHELSMFRQHFNVGQNVFQISVSNFDLDKSFAKAFIIKLGEYFLHKVNGLDIVKLRRTVMIRNTPGLIDDTDWWINYSEKGDHNPIHTHAATLSSVIYVKNSKDNSTFFKWGNNIIEYKPKDGWVVMFPSDLPHWVEEKTTSKERITGSINLHYNENWYNQDKPKY